MKNSENIAPRNRALRTASIALYTSLALLWLAIPSSVSNWTREYLPAFVQPVAAPITGTVEAIANATRVPLLYAAAREHFQAAAKK